MPSTSLPHSPTTNQGKGGGVSKMKILHLKVQTQITPARPSILHTVLQQIVYLSSNQILSHCVCRILCPENVCYTKFSTLNVFQSPEHTDLHMSQLAVSLPLSNAGGG